MKHRVVGGFPKAWGASSGDFRIPGGGGGCTGLPGKSLPRELHGKLSRGRIYRGSCAEDCTGVEST